MSERAVDLQVDVSGCNEDATAVIVEVSLRSFVEKYRLWIDDLAIAYPQIVSDERVMADEGAITETMEGHEGVY